MTRVTILSIKQAVWYPSRLGSRLGVMYQIGPWKHKSEMKLGFGVTRAGIDFRADVAMCVLGYILTLHAPVGFPSQAPLHVHFPRQEYCSGSPFPSPGDLPSPGIEPWSPLSPALAAVIFTPAPCGT